MLPLARHSTALSKQLRTACGTRGKSTAATASSANTSISIDDEPTLTKVPSLPLVGSLLPAYSGIPVPYDQSKVYEFWPAMREKYGCFYEMGMPGIGVGSKGIAYVLQCPDTMASILRQEGQYPSGSVEYLWAFRRGLQKRQMFIEGLFSHGPKWKRMRRFVQTDLLSKQSAERYVPAILEAAQEASKGAPAFATTSKLNEYLNLASFDLFANVMLGYLPTVSNPDGQADPKDLEFCNHAATALRLNNYLMLSVKDALLVQKLGIETKHYKEFDHHFGIVQELAKAKAEELFQLKKHERQAKQDDSYANRAFERVRSDDNDPNDKDMYVSMDEAKTIVGLLLTAGVDTTGGMLTFKLLHLASSQEVQDKLWHALQPTLVDGKLTPASLQLPYLKALLRESHRLASSVPIVLKSLPKERPIHGHVLPKGSTIILDTYSTGMQQDHFVEPVKEFVPERFLKEAVQERKGTSAAVVDHSYFSGPFSQGARKCPGSRLATLEAHALIAQWVLDYKMELPPNVTDIHQVPYGLETVQTAYLPAIQFSPR